MKLICVVKFVPDVDNFKYDFENNTLIRENVRLTLNPDDACAVATALKIKAMMPETEVEVVTMAPKTVIPHMKDLIRVGVDKGTILADRAYAGSDTYATSKVLGRYLKEQEFHCILSGTHAVDGDTSHVPAPLGELLDLNQLSGIVKVDFDGFTADSAQVDVETEHAVTTFEVDLPAILSITRESKYKLPYVRHGDMDKDVSAALQILGNEHLSFEVNEVGLMGSKTRVAATYNKGYETREQTVVKADTEGVETVFRYLKDKGYIG